jgi:outer membrane protein, heavy metal efflux system
MRGMLLHRLIPLDRFVDGPAATHRLGGALLMLTACWGCASPRQSATCSTPPATAPLAAAITVVPTLPENQQPAASVRSVAYHEPLSDVGELSLPELTAEVQARNPSVQAMVAAWQAASERYPQVVSLDDPMFGFMLGAQGLGHDGGWMVMAAQKIPWCGKRALRGEIARAEADAASRDVDDIRLRLAEATAAALADYYQARRELEINAANVELMTQFREAAKVRYESGQVSAQDVLQADLELAELESRRAEIIRDEKVATARINTLLHLPATSPLPRPPKELTVPAELPSADALQHWAVQQRPDLAAEAARIRADEASLHLADKEFYPDLEVVAKYDAFMPEDMRPQVGLNLNMPLRRSRRCAALSEAEAKLQQRRAEYESRLDAIEFDVQSAADRLAQERTVLRLYIEKVLPAAEANIRSAQANYTAGKIDFLRLLDAQRQLYREQEKRQQAAAECLRRLAELERAIGGPVPATP